MAVTGKLAEVVFEKAIETHEKQEQMLGLVDRFEPGSGTMQNSGNFLWRSVQQNAPIIDGFDLTGQETGIIEETYPAILGTPKNDFFEQRVDDLRDMQFWERRGVESGMKQAAELNKSIAALVANTGSMFFRSNATSGYDFVAQAQALMNERQQSTDMRCFSLNDRTNLKFGQDLAARQTLQGRPNDTWRTGQIGQNVADFDIYTASYLPNLAGGANPATTVTADVSEAPQAGSVSAAGVVTNVDYRVGSVAVAASASYNVGDRVTFSNGGNVVNALGLTDKTNTNQAMTFVIVAKPNGTTIDIFPKPIAIDDPALSVLEKAYANIDTQILSAATVDRVNIDALAKTNIFWAKGSIEVTSGDAPVELLSEFGGMKVISSSMKNGQKMYMAYDGDINKLTFKCRLFTWYGLTNKNPSANGVGISF